MTSVVNYTRHTSPPIAQDPSYQQLASKTYTNLESALIIYFALVSVALTVVGNGLVCLAVVLVRKLHQPPNYLLFSLALTDMAVGLLVEPLNVMYELNGSLNWISESSMAAWCRFYTSADLTLCTASILTLCAISVDRYAAITRPFSYCPKRTVARCLAYVLLVWMLALLISVSPLILLPDERVVDETGHFVCQIPQNIIYQVYATMGSFYIPACIILAVNYKIFRAARRLTHKDKQIINAQGSFSGKRKKSSLDRSLLAVAAASVVATRKSSSVASKKISCTSSVAGPHKIVSPCSSGGYGYGSSNNNNNNNRKYSPLSDLNGNFSSSDSTWRLLKQRLSRLSASSKIHQRTAVHGRKRRTFDNETKAMKTLAVITGAFLICWLPFFIVALVKAVCQAWAGDAPAPVDQPAPSTPDYLGPRTTTWVDRQPSTVDVCRTVVPRWLDVALVWLGYLNSALNPFIYAKYNRDFRVPLREMLCCRFGTLKSVLRRQEFTEHYGCSDGLSVKSSLPQPNTRTESAAIPLNWCSLNTNDLEAIDENVSLNIGAERHAQLASLDSAHL